MRPLRVSIACLCLCFAVHTVRAAQTTVTVYGHYDNSGGSGFIVSNGTDSVGSESLISVSPEVDYVTYYDTSEGYGYNPETGEYGWYTITTPRTEPDWSTQRTVYTASVPDQWVGRSLTFSWTGGFMYSMYAAFSSDGTGFYFTESHFYGLPPEQQNQLPFFDAQGNKVLIGKWWDDSSRSLLTLSTWDSFNAYWPSMGLDSIASRPNAFWRWIHPSDNGTGSEIAMELDYQHCLTLRGRYSASQRIQFDPNVGQITINGQPLITETATVNRYATRNETRQVMGTGANVGNTGIAIGSYASASGYYYQVPPTLEVPPTSETYYGEPIAIGERSSVSALGGMALGAAATATGAHSTALGGHALAGGEGSLSLGLKSQATRIASVAIGAFANATGRNSTALGYRTTAQGYGQTVVGVNNLPVGTDNPGDVTSEVFVVGNGDYAPVGSNPMSTPGNAFTVKRNGDTQVMGRLNVIGTGVTTVAGTLSVSGGGESVVHGSLKVNGALRVVPQGDISMGEFTAGPQP